MWEFRTGNTFAAMAFTSYGAFWLSFYLIQTTDTVVSDIGIGVYLLMWGVIIFYLWIGTFYLNKVLFYVFFFLWFTFLLLAFCEFGIIAFSILGGMVSLLTVLIL